jgi:hypothetical protein
MWNNVILILSSLVHYYLKNNKWWNYTSQRINILNNCNLFPIAWLYYLRSPNSIHSYNNSCHCNHTHLEASFIKIPNIIVKNSILYFNILNTFKLIPDKYRIFIFSMLIVVLLIKFRL